MTGFNTGANASHYNAMTCEDRARRIMSPSDHVRRSAQAIFLRVDNPVVAVVSKHVNFAHESAHAVLVFEFSG